MQCLSKCMIRFLDSWKSFLDVLALAEMPRITSEWTAMSHWNQQSNYMKEKAFISGLWVRCDLSTPCAEGLRGCTCGRRSMFLDKRMCATSHWCRMERNNWPETHSKRIHISAQPVSVHLVTNAENTIVKWGTEISLVLPWRLYTFCEACYGRPRTLAFLFSLGECLQKKSTDGVAQLQECSLNGNHNNGVYWWKKKQQNKGFIKPHQAFVLLAQFCFCLFDGILFCRMNFWEFCFETQLKTPRNAKHVFVQSQTLRSHHRKAT